MTQRKRRGFTLIELLVVIAIIAILAALIFPAVATINRRKIIAKAQAELATVKTAIENYKAKYNTYPPDNSDTSNPKRFMVNPLFYELGGVTHNKATDFYQPTLPGTPGLAGGAPLKSVLGVSGFVNASRGTGEDVSGAKNFLGTIRPGGWATNTSTSTLLLACTIAWPANSGYPLGYPGCPNPWQYNSSSPTNNPGSYDLWVDVLIGGKTNRISNWNPNPVTVN